MCKEALDKTEAAPLDLQTSSASSVLWQGCAGPCGQGVSSPLGTANRARLGRQQPLPGTAERLPGLERPGCVSPGHNCCILLPEQSCYSHGGNSYGSGSVRIAPSDLYVFEIQKIHR